MAENLAEGTNLENVTLTAIASGLLNLENAGKEFRKAVSHADTIKPLALSDAERRKQFGGRVRVMRKLLGLTQTQLAEKLGVTNPVIVYYEQGKKEPTLRNLLILAQTLNTSIDWLVTGNENWQREITPK